MDLLKASGWGRVIDQQEYTMGPQSMVLSSARYNIMVEVPWTLKEHFTTFQYKILAAVDFKEYWEVP